MVWAKLEGYPWWPAQIQDLLTPQQQRLKHGRDDYFCVFLGGNDFQWVHPRNVQDFSTDYARRARGKRPDLQQAIDAAWAVMGKHRPD